MSRIPKSKADCCNTALLLYVTTPMTALSLRTGCCFIFSKSLPITLERSESLVSKKPTLVPIEPLTSMQKKIGILLFVFWFNLSNCLNSSMLNTRSCSELYPLCIFRISFLSINIYSVDFLCTAYIVAVISRIYSYENQLLLESMQFLSHTCKSTA